ncbi:TPA: hypothetical protein QCR36_004105 [Bacillus cereus]|nr:hypothetical protein [Bacillus cereus]HDR4742570.1 hypothetical protein [Bacillus cereus]HDR4748159.1 hypothetical protein [Bacillus cereus]HDR4753631.1 hypothetical protein [Bacillus cereus]HDR4770840.1 hypothetical protein [Bacillus cereus]
MVELNEKEQLEELKGKINDIKGDLIIHIEEQFNDIFALINGRIEEICDAEHDDEFEDPEEEQEEYEERDVRDELTSEQEEEATVLSASIASQIQRANQENSDEEAPVVVVNSPAPSLAEDIKNQIEGVKTVVTETPVSLTEQIAKQVADKNNLAVVAPTMSEGLVDIPQATESAPRPLGLIIEELRNSVNTGVEATSVEKTEQLVEQAALQTTDDNAAQTSELVQNIKVQVLSDSIKKQL